MNQPSLKIASMGGAEKHHLQKKIYQRRRYDSSPNDNSRSDSWSNVTQNMTMSLMASRDHITSFAPVLHPFSFGKSSFVQLSFDQMSFVHLSLGQWLFDRMLSDQLSFGQ
jgi:hypothetical protein